MSKQEMICKNCKYHYIEEISFDYPQSCCDKRKAVIEEWFNCNDFKYSDKYIEQLQQENKQLKEVIDKIMNLIKKYGKYDGEKCTQGFQMWTADFNKILDILKEVSND